jgi:hypothetical protein
MSHNMEAVEATRARFRPERITTLFVGESAPVGGDFFYYGNNAMLNHVQRALEQALGPLAIVSLLMSIRTIVDAAAIEAGNDAPRFAVPFPGMGQQARFKAAMAQIIPALPRLPDAS